MSTVERTACANWDGWRCSMVLPGDVLTNAEGEWFERGESACLGLAGTPMLRITGKGDRGGGPPIQRGHAFGAV